MKHLLLFIIATLPFLAPAQTVPLVKDSAVWREADFTLISPPSTFGVYRVQYWMNGDTTINNLLYKKLYQTDFDSLISNPDYIAALREDSLGRVYAWYDSAYFSTFTYNHPLSQEYLLYDFSLSAGDTFYVSGVPDDSIRIVDYIDSAHIGGEWRKRIHFIQSGLSQRDWIAGIGSMKGLLFPHLFEFENYHQLICYQDNSVYWTHPDVTYDCLTVGIDEPVEPHVQEQVWLYPNPANSTIHYVYPGNNEQIDRIIIRDIGGRMLKKVSHNSVQAQIPIADLLPGMYIVSFCLDNGKIISKKIIKTTE